MVTKTLKLQAPAEGILKRNDWGNSKLYQVVCECGVDAHDHTVWVEVDDTECVNVTVYTTVTSKWWKLNRWQQIWTLLTKGYVEYEATIIMSEQQALNYAEVLKSAVKDVQEFKRQ
jgi:hypothetical protein